MSIHILCTSSNSLNIKPTTKLNKYCGTNFFLSIIKLKTSNPWKIYVHVPSDTFGITSENAYGTLDIAEIPAPECNISTTPKLLIITANASANSPLNICKFSLSIVYPSIVFAFYLHIGFIVSHILYCYNNIYPYWL